MPGMTVSFRHRIPAASVKKPGHGAAPRAALPNQAWRYNNLMTADRKTARQPCSVALGAAQAAQVAVTPDTVILFGSRARGDHRPNSDIDLLVIYHHHSHLAAAGLVRHAAQAYLKQHPPNLPVSAIAISREQFNWARRAKNHVAGQALRDGIIMSSENLDYSPAGAGDEPVNWPDVKERIRAAYRNAADFNNALDHDLLSQELAGFLGQQAVENALKAWISAAGADYRAVHDLDEFADKLLSHPTEAATAAAQQLIDFVQFTRKDPQGPPGQRQNWLTEYAVIYRYTGAGYRMDDLEKTTFQEMVNQSVTAFVRRAQELTGTTDQDLRP